MEDLIIMDHHHHIMDLHHLMFMDLHHQDMEEGVIIIEEDAIYFK